MNISFNPIDICSRDYDDFCVIYDLRNKQILNLENVAADIWRIVVSKASTTDNEITAMISKEYECDEDDIREDILEFIEELYSSGVILIDNKYIQVDEYGESEQEEDDYEGIIIGELEKRNQIYSATFEMTYACNEKCVHCYANFPNVEEHQPIELSTYKKAVDDLLDLKCMHLAFTGGDPFMNKEFPQLFEYSRKKGFVCDIFTNALYLFDHEDVLDKIVHLRPRAFYISLYGSSPEIHDRITQIPGSFDKTIAVAKRLRSMGVSVVFNMMILTLNHLDIDNMIRLANDLKSEYRVSMSIIHRNDGSAEPMDYFVGDKDAIKRVLKCSQKKYYSMDKPSDDNVGEYMCGAGVTSLSIAPDGAVYPCISLKNPLGSIISGSIKDAWHNDERQALSESLKWSNTLECKDCTYKEDCKHCPGISQAETGNIFSCNTCDKAIAECAYEGTTS